MPSKSRRLLLFGSGGHGKVVAEAAQAMGCFGMICFGNDTPPGDRYFARFPFLGSLENAVTSYSRRVFDVAIVSIGDNTDRARIQQVLVEAGIPLATIIHPSSVVSPTARIGAGSVVMAGAIVQAGVSTGSGVILNTHCGVDHDCRLGDFVHCAPAATLCGGVVVRERTLLGAGSSLIPGVCVGRDCRIGAGAAVVQDVPDATTVVGVPARILT